MTTPARQKEVSKMSAAVNIRGLAELVPAIPYLLGFYPGESTVVLIMDGDQDGPKAVISAGRVDNADLTAESAREVMTGVVGRLPVVEPGRTRTAVVVAYSLDEDKAVEASQAATVGCCAVGLEVQDVAVVVGPLMLDVLGSGVWSVVEPHPGTERMLRDRLAAPAADRGEVVARVLPGERAPEVARCAGALVGRVTPQECQGAWLRVLTGPEPVESLPTEVLAVAAAGVQNGREDRQVRDGLSAAVLGFPALSEFPGAQVPALEEIARMPREGMPERLAALARCLDGPNTTCAATIVAGGLWACCSSSVMVLALLERLPDRGPHQVLTGLIGEAVRLGINPKAVAEAAHSM